MATRSCSKASISTSPPARSSRWSARPAAASPPSCAWCSGQEAPSRGKLTLDDTPLPAEPGPDRGVVFQRYSVFPHLTVLGNVLAVLRIRREPVPRQAVRCEAPHRVGEGEGAGRCRRARRACREISERAVRRPAAAARHRPGARQGAEGAAARRAVRRARPRHPHPDAPADQAALARTRHDGDNGDARSEGGVRARHPAHRLRQAPHRPAGAQPLRRPDYLRPRPDPGRPGASVRLLQANWSQADRKIPSPPATTRHISEEPPHARLSDPLCRPCPCAARARRHHPNFEIREMQGWKALEAEGISPPTAGARSSNGRSTWACPAPIPSPTSRSRPSRGASCRISPASTPSSRRPMSRMSATSASTTPPCSASRSTAAPPIAPAPASGRRASAASPRSTRRTITSWASTCASR